MIKTAETVISHKVEQNQAISLLNLQGEKIYSIRTTTVFQQFCLGFD